MIGFSSAQWTAFWTAVGAVATVCVAVVAIAVGLAEVARYRRDAEERARVRGREIRQDLLRLNAQILDITGSEGPGIYLSLHNMGDTTWAWMMLAYAYWTDDHDLATRTTKESAMERAYWEQVSDQEFRPMPSFGHLEHALGGEIPPTIRPGEPSMTFLPHVRALSRLPRGATDESS